MVNKKELVWDWTINRKFPFLHIYKRDKYVVEEIIDNAIKAENLMFATLPIFISAKLINKVKKIFHK